MKRILIIITIIFSIILLKLLTTFLANEILIYRDLKNKNSKNIISFLKITNLNEPYIIYYNEGNTLFKQKKYDKAIENYEISLDKKPPQKKRCDIRINIVLSIMKQIDTRDKQKAIQKLEEAQSLLYLDNCANKKNDQGKSQESEELEEEINQTIDQLKQDPSNQSEKENNINQDTSEEENETEEEKNMKEQLNNINKDAQASRQKDLQTYENLGNYQYYSGKNW